MSNYFREELLTPFIIIFIIIIIGVGILFLCAHYLYPKKGEVWIKRNNDPFNPDSAITIIDVQGGWVQYKKHLTDTILSKNPGSMDIIYLQDKYKRLKRRNDDYENNS